MRISWRHNVMHLLLLLIALSCLSFVNAVYVCVVTSGAPPWWFQKHTESSESQCRHPGQQEVHLAHHCRGFRRTYFLLCTWCCMSDIESVVGVSLCCVLWQGKTVKRACLIAVFTLLLNRLKISMHKLDEKFESNTVEEALCCCRWTTQ